MFVCLDLESLFVALAVLEPSKSTKLALNPEQFLSLTLAAEQLAETEELSSTPPSLKDI